MAQAEQVDLGFRGEVAEFYHRYRRGYPAEDTDLPVLGELLGPRSLGAVTIAQALHWMSHAEVFRAAAPLARPGGGVYSAMGVSRLPAASQRPVFAEQIRAALRPLDELGDATGALVDGIGGLTDAVARGPSLLPGWTRGHVLTHLARNAEGGTRLLGWARTGAASYEYESVAARADAIEDGAGRRAVVLLADVSATSAAFAEAAAVMPAGAWQNMVTWTTGQQTPAEEVIRSRLAEVLIHHVDLDLGFGPDRWPPVFVREMLSVAVNSLNERSPAPLSALLSAADTGQVYRLGADAATAVRLSGSEAGLLAWVLGRASAAKLTQDMPGPLPAVPSIYYT